MTTMPTLSETPQLPPEPTTSRSGSLSSSLPDYDEVIYQACFLLDRAINDHRRAQLEAEGQLSRNATYYTPHERWGFIKEARRLLAGL
jgi:hypothetical protein